jgi:peptide/nickel transport system ATP-binding protein
MRQRVVIALALCADPALVIADEPTTALDVSVQAHILQLLRDLHRESRVGMLLITHDLGVIAKMADRVAVFYAGRVAEIGPVAELFHSPRHPYTRGLINATPMPAEDGAIRLDQIPGAMPGLGAVPAGCAFNPRCFKAEADCRVTVPSLLDDGAATYSCFHPLERQAAQ